MSIRLQRHCLPWIIAVTISIVTTSHSFADTVLIAPKPVVWAHYLGVNAPFLWFSRSQYSHQIRLLKALGLHWVRVDLHWAMLEPRKGHFHIASLTALIKTLSANHLKSDFYFVGSAKFASSAPAHSRYFDQYPPANPRIYALTLAALVSRYPSVTAWEVWNEPNLPAFWRPSPNPLAYAHLLQDAVNAIRQDSPHKIIVIGGMGYYSQMPNGRFMLRQLATLGALHQGLIVAYHPYSMRPSGDNPAAQDFLMRGHRLNRALRAAGVSRIWADEWGWSSYTGPKSWQPIIGRRGQAEFTLQRLALMSAMDYDRIFLFSLSDLDNRASPRDRHYGLLDLNGHPKPVYRALSRFLATTGPRLLPDHPPCHTGAPAGLYSIAWRKPNGTHVWMFWSQTPGHMLFCASKNATLTNPLSGQTQYLDHHSHHSLVVPVIQDLQLLTWQ